jgi:UDP-N-acetylglucosamine:LPS N-acetylglucosamine transferase
MTAPKICLLFSNSGGGHRSATLAIQAALDEILAQEKLTNSVEIISDTLVEKSHPINRAFVSFYNFLLRHSQASVKYYFQFLHMLKPNDSAMGYRITSPYIKELFSREQPVVVVAVHPMINQYIPRVIEECGLTGQTKFITLVTDPNDRVWKGWASPHSDLTIVPNDLTRNKLISWGVPAQKIKAIGMPIHPNFIRPAQTKREDFRRQLGLKPDVLTVCINSGWAGGGNLMAIYKALKLVKKEIQVLFLCGHYSKLYEDAMKQARFMKIPTAVLPFHNQMSELMSAVDLMVTKAGGLTTFEAIARRLPLAIDVITEPMPQEAGNVELLVNAGLAKPIRQPNDIVTIVESLDPAADRNLLPLPSIYNLDKVNAVYEIAKIILDYATPRKAKPIKWQKSQGGDITEEVVTRVVEPKVVGLE